VNESYGKRSLESVTPWRPIVRGAPRFSIREVLRPAVRARLACALRVPRGLQHQAQHEAPFAFGSPHPLAPEATHEPAPSAWEGPRSFPSHAG
jgi:hypothetical protein